MICLDVYYQGAQARACGVVFASGPPERVLAEHCVTMAAPAAYIPGQFFRRELPCLLAVLGQVREPLNLIFVDGYVQLAGGTPGLGRHLYRQLGGATPVVGVAKAPFPGAAPAMPVYRGGSRRPLYVSSAGLPLEVAAALVRNLGGSHRLPAVLRRVDQLTRAEADG